MSARRVYFKVTTRSSLPLLFLILFQFNTLYTSILLSLVLPGGPALLLLKDLTFLEAGGDAHLRIKTHLVRQ